jgi:hypothetical protein
MSNVIPFTRRVADPAADPDIDIFTAVDAAIRDLRDISRDCDDTVRDQVDECRRMLELAFHTAVGEA